MKWYVQRVRHIWLVFNRFTLLFLLSPSSIRSLYSFTHYLFFKVWSQCHHPFMESGFLATPAQAELIAPSLCFSCIIHIFLSQHWWPCSAMVCLHVCVYTDATRKFHKGRGWVLFILTFPEPSTVPGPSRCSVFKEHAKKKMGRKAWVDVEGSPPTSFSPL